MFCKVFYRHRESFGKVIFGFLSFARFANRYIGPSGKCHVHFQCFEDGSGEGAGARGSPSRPRRSGARVSHAGCLASSLPSPLIMLLSLCRNIRLPIRTRLGRRRPDMLTPWRWRAKRAFAAGAAGTRPTCASAASRSSAGTESFGTPARIPATGA